jgi:hypothetical protein
VGTLVNLVRHSAERLQQVDEETKTALRRAPMLHNDETGSCVVEGGRVVGAEGARLEWIHVTCTPNRTHYAVTPLVAHPRCRRLAECQALLV